MTLWVISCFGLLTAMAFAHRLTTIEAHLVEHLDRQANSLKGVLMSTQDAVNAVTAQLVKAQAEIVNRIDDVQAQLDAASVPAEVVDLSSLIAAAQRLDDVVPDELIDEVVVEEPVVEAPADDVEPDVEPVDG